MKKAAGLLELLIVIVVIIVLYLAYSNGQGGRKNPFEEQREIKTKQEIVNTKLKEIESKKQLRDKIEQNLIKESY